MVKTTERHGEAPLKYDLFSGYTGGLFSLPCRLSRILYLSRLHFKKKRRKEKKQDDPSCRLSDIFHKLKTDRKVKEITDFM